MQLIDVLWFLAGYLGQTGLTGLTDRHQTEPFSLL